MQTGVVGVPNDSIYIDENTLASYENDGNQTVLLYNMATEQRQDLGTFVFNRHS